MNFSDIKIVKQRRKTLKLELIRNELVLSVPENLTKQEIKQFFDTHREWFEEGYVRLCEGAKRRAQIVPFTEEEINDYFDRAIDYIPKRVKYYADIIGVTYHRVTIRNQTTLWGSCSSKQNLNFNCLLILAPPEVVDAVVVHELCHILHPNHSKDFYNDVLKYCPDYYQCDQWLRDNGSPLLQRMKQYLSSEESE